MQPDQIYGPSAARAHFQAVSGMEATISSRRDPSKDLSLLETTQHKAFISSLYGRAPCSS